MINWIQIIILNKKITEIDIAKYSRCAGFPALLRKLHVPGKSNRYLPRWTNKSKTLKNSAYTVFFRTKIFGEKLFTDKKNI